MADAPHFTLNAGHRALDFVNTLDETGSPEGAVDSLSGYANVLQFCEATAILNGAAVRALTRFEQPKQDAAFGEALKLRAILFSIFSAVARNQSVPSTELSALNGYLERALRHRQLTRRSKVFAWTWSEIESHAAGPLWPIALDAAELLVSDRLQLVRECANDTCTWLFLDTSKNHSRRWCDMKTCGNRVKARTHYQRVRGAGGV